MKNSLGSAGEPARLRVPAASAGFDMPRAGLRGEMSPGLPLRPGRSAVQAQVAELLHELATPLGVASMAASLHAERLRELKLRLGGSACAHAGALLADLDETSQLLADSVERALRLLRHHDRPEAAAGEPPLAAPRVLPLATLLEQALRSTLAQHSEQAIACEIDVEPGLATPGQPGAWRQVFDNLVGNSAQHGFEGRHGGRVSVVARRSSASVLRVTYRDDGVGLSPAAREQAFRRRFTSRAAQGASGLGLCTLRDIVQGQLNGAIALLESPVGAAFAIDVPASPSRPAA